jgi:hypothetical protein
MQCSFKLLERSNWFNRYTDWLGFHLFLLRFSFLSERFDVESIAFLLALHIHYNHLTIGLYK